MGISQSSRLRILNDQPPEAREDAGKEETKGSEFGEGGTAPPRGRGGKSSPPRSRFILHRVLCPMIALQCPKWTWRLNLRSGLDNGFNTSARLFQNGFDCMCTKAHLKLKSPRLEWVWTKSSKSVTARWEIWPIEIVPCPDEASNNTQHWLCDCHLSLSSASVVLV